MSKNPSKIKILVVGNPESIHAARFVNLLQEIGYHVEIFHSEYLYNIDEHLKNTIIHVAFPYKKPSNNNILKGYRHIFDLIVTKMRRRSENLEILLPLAIKQIFFYKQNNRVFHLAGLIKTFRPDIIFSLKLQHESYTVLKAKEILKERFNAKWVYFSWGSDLEFFGKDPHFKKEHLPNIIKLLKNCDYHLADCHRDVLQARKLGFKGMSLGTCLAMGGYDLDEIAKIRQKYKKRNFIIIKGRQDAIGGKAVNVLLGLQKILPLLKNYQIKFIYSNHEVRPIIKFLKELNGLDYEEMGWLSYKDVLNLYAQSRLAISDTAVEGTPSFLVEAMALGAFPIHSDLNSIREWVKTGKNGLLFPADDISKLADSIKRALKDDKLMKEAQKINWQIALERLSRDKIRAHIKDLVENKILR